jgi:pentatricopeptide repeat protein
LGRWEEARRFLKEGMKDVVAAAADEKGTTTAAAAAVPGTAATAATAGHSALAWGRTYGALLTLCSKRIEPTRALELLEEMEERGIAPDAEAYHAVMDACAQAGMEGEVRTVFEKMRGRGDIVPSVESFTIMLELCGREGEKGEEALRLMADLEELGLTPDMLCFNAAMEACREASLGEGGKEGGRFRAAMRKWRDCEVMHTYNSEMAVLATRKRGFDDGGSATALRYLKEMRDNGIPRDTDSFNMALEACARAGDLMGVRGVFAELQVEGGGEEGVGGVRPDIFSYITMANSLCSEGQGGEAMAWLNYMVGLASDGGGSGAGAGGAVAAATPAAVVDTKVDGGGEKGKGKTGTGGGGGRAGAGKQQASTTTKRNSKTSISQAAPPPLPPSLPPSPPPTRPPTNVGIRKKTRWPAYYRLLWPQTAKTLSKTILTLASSVPPSQQATRCAEIGRLLCFLSTHVPILNTQVVAEQLVGRGLCTTEHIKTLTGDALTMRWREGAEQVEGNNANGGGGLF